MRHKYNMSFPVDLVKRLDAERDRRGNTRSGLIIQACEALLSDDPPIRAASTQQLMDELQRRVAKQ